MFRNKQWTEKDLSALITSKVEESLYLEYKASAALSFSDKGKDEIAKDVSSFVNSDGGTIIYGIKEDAQNRHLPGQIDPIDRAVFTKEQLENIITSRITPRVSEFIITPVPIASCGENMVVYVVEISKGKTAHQSSDKRYYKRFNFKSTAMDDWEIRDILNRRNQAEAKLLLYAKFPKTWLTNPSMGLRMEFALCVNNSSNRVIEYCDLILSGTENLSKYFVNPKLTLKNGIKGKIFEHFVTNEKEYSVNVGGRSYTVNHKRFPILPNTYREVGRITILSDFFLSEEKLKVNFALDDNRINTVYGPEDLKKQVRFY